VPPAAMARDRMAQKLACDAIVRSWLKLFQDAAIMITLADGAQVKAAAVAGCVCRKLDSAILVMKSAEHRLWCNDAEALNRPMERGILVQRSMNARSIIIGGIPATIIADDPAPTALIVPTVERVSIWSTVRLHRTPFFPPGPSARWCPIPIRKLPL
jgi:hypothetical protein